MDNHRPELDLKFYDKICPDLNVPVIAVFTKYDQFLCNVKMDINRNEVVENLFQDHYLRPLGNNVKYVQLEKMHMKDSRCDCLVEETAAALNEDTVVLMLLAVQMGNIELSVKTALSHVHRVAKSEVKSVIQKCIIPFPYIWAKCEWLWCLTGCHGLVWIPVWTWTALNRTLGVVRFEVQFLNFPGVSLLYKTMQVKSLPAIQNIINNDASQHHLIIVIILILKHATFLWPSNKLQLALSQAGQNYQEANMDSKIQEYLKAFSSEDTVEIYAGFIMATDMVPSQSSVGSGESGFRSQFLHSLPIFQKLRKD
ncbi:hypothetical protein EI94DRAFT_1730396 [Lactarius quietus]|nr:hypothetical protein EI94DRAFT_1730396 [Lactarius quietus]